MTEAEAQMAFNQFLIVSGIWLALSTLVAIIGTIRKWTLDQVTPLALMLGVLWLDAMAWSLRLPLWGAEIMALVVLFVGPRYVKGIAAWGEISSKRDHHFVEDEPESHLIRSPKK